MQHAWIYGAAGRLDPHLPCDAHLDIYNNITTLRSPLSVSIDPLIRLFTVSTPIRIILANVKMHLIKTDGSYKMYRIDAAKLWDDRSKSYAILSHTWAKNNDEEVSFRDMNDLAKAKAKPGWGKIQESCAKAARDKIPYVWIDTCCIDKTGSHDQILGEINSMFQYYAQAEVCYVYLSDLPGSCPQLTDRSKLQEVWPKSNWTWAGHIRYCRWFRRGWTLQELIAPKKVEFYNGRWRWIGSLRGGLRETVAKITQIPLEVLEKKSGMTLEHYTIAQRMAWAANRTTTYEADMAYCLLGIFNIQMASNPGEGLRAFERLQLAILARSTDQSIFAWQWSAGIKRKGGNESLLAPHPKHFLSSRPILPLYASRAETASYTHPYEMTNRGLEIRLPIISDSSKPAGSRSRLALLNCAFGDSKGQKERVALPVREIDDGKKRGMNPIYEVHFEAFSKPNAKGEKEYTRLIAVPKKEKQPSMLKADQTIILLSGFI